MMIADDDFLSLLQQRRRRRAAVLSSGSCHSHDGLHLLPDPPSSPSSPLASHLKGRSFHAASNRTTNLSTHYLFSSARPQNEIQNPYPNCFEGYPKLQRSL